MATSVGATGTISSTGLGSGLDVTSIISKLMTIESQPLVALQTKYTGIQTKISAYAAVKSAISTFRDAARTLTSPDTWSATSATSGDTSTVSVSSTSAATKGSYSVVVQALAAAQSTASGFFGSSTTSGATAVVGAGTLHIDNGSWTTANGASTFTANTDSNGVALPGTDIVVSSTATLSDVRDQINAANAGVTASIVTDATGSRLVMTSTATGSANGFRATVADADGNNTDANGLSKIAYDPAGGAVGTLSQAAANASATINGLAVTSATNSLTGAVTGLTLNLSKVNTTPVQIGVSQDNAGMTAAVQTFATAYSALATLLSTDTKYDATTTIAGPLQADSTAVSLQRALRNIVGSNTNASSAFSSLSQVGLEIQTDGTLTVNATKLTSGLGNLAGIKALFANSDTTNGTDKGIAQQLRIFTDSVLNSDGALTTRTAGLNTSLTTNQKQQDDMNVRLTATRARLTSQYTTLDTKMATLTTLSDYVTQQIANWNKSS